MEYLIHLAILISIYVILGISLNLVVGYTGLLSVAHAAFYGLGAYATALLITGAGLNFFIAAGAGMFVAFVASLCIGVVLSRFRDDYYALASLGFNVIIFGILLNWQSLTRGPLGIPGITRPSLGAFTFTGNAPFLLLSLASALTVFLLARALAGASFGRVLKAIREDEQAIAVFGYRTEHYKLAVFAIGAAMAALAGALFAAYITFIDPTTFNVSESIFILALIILGGLGTLKGAVLGAIVMTLLPEALRFVGLPHEVAAQTRQLIYGLALILLMRFRPKGLVGEYKL